MDPGLRDRLCGMLVGLAVGDALGAGVEFRPPGSFPPVTGYRGGTHPIPPGGWTDDTSMALALADSLATVGWDPDDQMRRYLRWRDHGEYSVIDRCFDIGVTTCGALQRFKAGTPARSCGDADEYSAGNGSIMRLAPVVIAYAGCYPDRLETLTDHAAESSQVTHATPVCLDACRYLAVVLAALAHGEERAEVLSPEWRMLDQLGELHPAILEVARGSFRAKQPPLIRGGGYVVHCLEAALWAFSAAEDFRDAVLRGVNLGEDADTAGAVCGQLAGARWGESGIPAEWKTGLVRGQRVTDAAERLLESAIH